MAPRPQQRLDSRDLGNLGEETRGTDQVPHREALWKFLQDSFLPSTQARAVFSKQSVKVRV